MSDGSVNDMSIMIGGDAGQGVESSGAGFALSFARAGLHVFAMQDYRSRIRGGHNFYQIRLSERPRYSHSNPIHLLLALTPETVALHLDSIAEGGAVIFPDRFEIDEEPLKKRGIRVDALPLMRIAEEHGSRVMTNTAALGAAAGVAEFPIRYMESVISDNFARKGQAVVDSNLKVAQAAYEMARQRYGADFAHKLRPVSGAPKRMLINGNEALAMGALAGGCRFAAAYPMTPATPIFEVLAGLPHEYGVVTKHAEDEIAAACMTIGAAFAGARAMTVTSGGGFCLMVESLGLAGMTEVPMVVVEAQRGGPSTGLPTRTEQGDLLFAINAAQGEFPRIVTAPGTVEECFEAGWRSFNLAEKYQCPVIVLTDSFLASSLRTLDMDAIDFRTAGIDRGATLTYEELERLTDGYKRFELSDDGISPRAILGHPKGVFAASTDEHDEYGHITEEIENRRRMMHKRMRKLEIAEGEMRTPALYGPQEAEVTLVCWGSTYGPCREAADEINAAGGSANVLQFTDLWPLPAEPAAAALRSCRRTVAVEQNYTSQLARLVRMTTGIQVDQTLTKYDGRPFAPEEIAAGLELPAGAARR
ncbi:MAG TPA: 2-oxoacid:acceptor oxidoreductase subunit alpha [Dehalococcoidia bacterium]|nr:2-oxoacid:acceptor oxidoreductase subunit alpha [Dehalococcoidia bacterium]